MTVNSLAGASVDGRLRRAAWYAPLVPIAISIFAVSALVSYHLRAGAIMEARTVAQSLIIGIYQFLGWVPSCMFFGLVLAWSSIWWVSGSIEQPGKKLLRVFALTLALAVFGNLDTPGPHTGALGAFVGGGLVSIFGSFLSHLLLAPLTFFALLLATDYFWMSFFERRAFERALPTATASSMPPRESQELGVEAAVTEEFKALARWMPGTEPAVGAAPHYEPQDVQKALDAYFEGGDAAAVAAEAAAKAAIELEIDDVEAQAAAADADAAMSEPAEWSRLSYFERRQLRAERDARAHAEVSDAPEGTVEAEGDRDEIAALRESSVERDYELPSAHGDRDAVASADESGSTDVGSVDEGDEFAVAAAELDRALVDSNSTLEGDDSADDEIRVLGEIRVLEPREAEAGIAATAAPAPEMASPAPEPTGPVLDADALRNALGFASETEREVRVEPQPAPESATEQPAEAAPSLDSFAMQTEPLFPTSAAAFAASDDDGDSEVAAVPAEDATAQLPRELMDDESEGDEPIAAVRGEATFELERPRGFLAPVVDADSDTEGSDSDTEGAGSDTEGAGREAEGVRSSALDEEDASVDAEADAEPVVAIPRPPEGPRQQSLFLSTLDDALVREAIDIIESSRRASAALLQRKLRIDHDQAKELLALLAHRGLLELAADGTQGRVLG